MLHFALGGAIGYAFSDLSTWGSFGISAFLGLLRELIQNLRFDGWRPYWEGSKADAGVDLTFWWIGAAIVSAFT